MQSKLEPKSEADSGSSQLGFDLLDSFQGDKIHVQLLESRQPTCHNCGQVATRKVASSFNTNNPGRAYYICPSCPWDCRWVCWADSRGVSAHNPPCYCEVPSRLDIIGPHKGVKAGRAFWACVRGRCWYYSENEEGTPGVSHDGGFYP